MRKGDSLWKIAYDNNISLEELKAMNPQLKNNIIHVGDKINLDHQYETSLVNIRDREKQEAEYNKDDISAIKHATHYGNYVIIDKANGLLQVFDKSGNLLFGTEDISFGKAGTDYNTVTYSSKDGSLENFAGNNSTPAGISKITNVGNYHGVPSFTRARFDPITGKVNQVKAWKKDSKGNWYESDELTDDNLASAIHVGNTSGKKNSNGCIRIGAKSLKELGNYLGVGSEIYTLPEQPGSRFTLSGGKLNYIADNPYGITKKGKISESGHDMVNWDDYNTYIDKSYSPLVIKPKRQYDDPEYNKNALDYVNTLSTNKEQIQKEFGLTSNEYNKLAQLAVGIAQQESKFGTAKSYKIKQMTGDIGQDAAQYVRGVIKDIKKNPIKNYFASRLGLSALHASTHGSGREGMNAANSKGYSQIKYDADITNTELKTKYDKLGVTKQSLETAQGSAIATIARLAYMYNTEIKGRTFKGENNSNIDKYDALLYKYQGKHNELKNNTATPNKNIYIANVHRYLDDFEYYEEVKRRKQ